MNFCHSPLYWKDEGAALSLHSSFFSFSSRDKTFCFKSTPTHHSKRFTVRVWMQSAGFERAGVVGNGRMVARYIGLTRSFAKCSSQRRPRGLQARSHVLDPLGAAVRELLSMAHLRAFHRMQRLSTVAHTRSWPVSCPMTARRSQDILGVASLKVPRTMGANTRFYTERGHVPSSKVNISFKSGPGPCFVHAVTCVWNFRTN